MCRITKYDGGNDVAIERDWWLTWSQLEVFDGDFGSTPSQSKVNLGLTQDRSEIFSLYLAE